MTPILLISYTNMMMGRIAPNVYLAETSELGVVLLGVEFLGAIVQEIICLVL